MDSNLSPSRFKPTFVLHCIVAEDIDTGTVYEWVQDECKNFKQWVIENVTEVIGHNIINYDLLVLKGMYGMDYSIRDTDDGEDMWCGKPCTITDTLVMSKVLNPDRELHGIEYYGRILGLEKIDWRGKAIELDLIPHNAPKGEEFKTYHPEMLVYNRRDVSVNKKVYYHLLKEWGEWNWTPAYVLEKQVAEIICRQEHRGFWFDLDMAKELVVDLDAKMEAIRVVVEPLIPEKRLTKTKAKEYIPPAKQFLKTGKPNSFILKFLEKHGATLVETPSSNGLSTYTTELFGKKYTLPIEQVPLVQTEPATITDTTHLKEWLVALGWEPTAWKERDLTVNTKKQKLTKEQFEAAVNRYVDQTLESNFRVARCDHLNCSTRTLRDKLLSHDLKKPLKVLTNPQLTVGQDKELCPGLVFLEKRFPHAKDVADYLTYRHRRNSILGGGVDPDDEEDAEKGYMSASRIFEDHRIPTPADTCGCNTSRMKHRLVANVPRATSLYGAYMRDLFKCDPSMLQLGYDGDGLEARIEAHYCYKYQNGPEYAVQLVSPKPHDIHTVTAKKISDLIGEAFPRDAAKATKYACTYGAQPPKLAKINGWSIHMANEVFNGFWEAALPLKLLKEAVTKFWEGAGKKKFVPGIDGRKIPTRSAHSLLNSLFQSAGLICMKKAMVLHDRWMRAEGLLVDFWMEDYRSKVYAQQMIAYHDEAQFELSRSLVKFKMFDTEEEAKAWTPDDGKIWSDVGHAPDGRAFRAYSRVGELAAIAVNTAGKHFKLNVELTSGYILGRSWKDCH